MTKKIKSIIADAKAWAKDNEEITTGLDNDCEEVNVHCLPMDQVLKLLDNIEAKILNSRTYREIIVWDNFFNKLRYSGIGVNFNGE